MRWLGAALCTSLAPLWLPRASLRLRRAALGCFSFHTRPTVRGCQGVTRFDCQKLEKNLKIKTSGGVFLQTGGLLGSMEGTAVFDGMADTAVCSKLKSKFCFRQRVRRHRTRKSTAQSNWNHHSFHFVKSKNFLHCTVQS